MSILSKPYFHDEKAAFAELEKVLWPDGPVCPHCGEKGNIYKLEGVRSKPSKKHPEGVERHGLRKCGNKECRKQFTVRVGTVFESSHIPLHKWLQAVHLMCSSKKGMSAHQMHRVLEITYKSAWFMAHRIREAMRTGELAPMGGNGSIAEADETFIGNKKNTPKGRGGYAHKMAVLSLVERGGAVRSFQIDKARTKDIQPIVNANLDRESMLMTDEATYYGPVGKRYKHHFTVEHGSGEYVRGSVHTNTLEGYFSIFKRGIKGVYQHVSEKHLHRYLAEFDFRYNNRIAVGVDDSERAKKTLKNIRGKRLKYEGSDWCTKTEQIA